MKIMDLVPWRVANRDVAATATAADPMRALQSDVDRAFDQFWRTVPPPFPSFSRLVQAEPMRVDVVDNGKEITVAAELPGMTDTDIEVSVRDGQLTIRGEKKSDRESEANGILVKERVYGVMQRTVPLPQGVDASAAKAAFTNGVLKIVIPKSADAQAKTKRIPVQAG